MKYVSKQTMAGTEIGISFHRPLSFIDKIESDQEKVTKVKANFELSSAFQPSNKTCFGGHCLMEKRCEFDNFYPYNWRSFEIILVSWIFNRLKYYLIFRFNFLNIIHKICCYIQVLDVCKFEGLSICLLLLYFLTATLNITTFCITIHFIPKKVLFTRNRKKILKVSNNKQYICNSKHFLS